MCGIAGIVGPLDRPRSEAAVDEMLRAQILRGPDDGGSSVVESNGGHVCLGNRRLAILDLSPLGHQPMINADTGDVLVHNGELYNFAELREELESAGYTFRSTGDTEVLLRAYQHWGIACLDKLHGMFAFALWDARRRRLVLVRDPLGIKPVYFATNESFGFVFASELRALLASGLVGLTLDQRAVAGLLAFGAIQEPLTIASDVKTLPAGHFLEIDERGRVVLERQYWDFPVPDPKAKDRPLGDLVAEGRALLEKAVRRHLLSDVPLGVFLSSGLDSTSVLGLARLVSTDEVHAFTVCFPDEPRFDEGPTAHANAARLGVTHHLCEVDHATALSWTRAGLDSMDQPTVDGLNTFVVSRAVRQENMVVALSGQGGDEILGGYATFRRVPRIDALSRWMRPLSPGLRASVARPLTSPLRAIWRGKLRDLAQAAGDLTRLYFVSRRLLSDDELDAAGVRPSHLDLDDGFQTPGFEASRHVLAEDPIASVARLETAYYLRNTLLRDGDVFSMASSLELRVPLLDRAFVEWAFRLPGDVLLPRAAPSKFLLRQMCGEFFMTDHGRRPKRGFTLPLAKWLQGPLRELASDALSLVRASGVIEPAVIDRVRDAFAAHPDSWTWSRLWVLVALGHWLGRRPDALVPGRVSLPSSRPAPRAAQI
jgi:asparagine synthase (glutamine-hydrolysing)